MITNEQFCSLDIFFDHYNRELFGDKLGDCMITISRKNGAPGHFSPFSWKKKGKKEVFDIHEISLNPDFLNGKDEESHAILVREMVNMWQEDFGKPSLCSEYYNIEWAQKMEEIGLIPTSTGKPGGNKTGKRVGHYIDSDGLFMKAFKDLSEKHIKYVSALSLQEDKKTTSKTKYICPCGNKVWGKSGLIIICGVCNQRYEEVMKELKKSLNDITLYY